MTHIQSPLEQLQALVREYDLSYEIACEKRRSPIDGDTASFYEARVLIKDRRSRKNVCLGQATRRKRDRAHDESVAQAVKALNRCAADTQRAPSEHALAELRQGLERRRTKLEVEITHRPTLNQPYYRVKLYVGDERIGEGTGATQDEAARVAATQGLRWFDRSSGRGALQLVLTARGFHNEERVLQLLEDSPLRIPRPDWLHGGRSSTIGEDAQGIDIIVHTVRGPINVQIKSSNAGKEKFLERTRYRDGSIPVFVADQPKHDYLFEEFLRFLTPLYERLPPLT